MASGEGFFELANAMLWTADPEGRLCDANAETARVLGRSASELAGVDLAELVHPADRGVFGAMLATLVRGEQARAVSMRLRGARGEWRRLQIDAVARPPAGRIYAVAHDVTDDRTASAAAQALWARAERDAQRLRADLVAHEIVHALRQPLSIIVNDVSAAARFMAKGPEFAERAGDAVARGVREALRASDTLEQTRGAVRAKRADMRSVDLNTTARAAVTLVAAKRRATANELGIGIELADDLPSVRGDPALLEHAVLELLDNALDAVSASRPEQAAAAVVLRTQVLPGRGSVELSVRDHGCGVPAAVRSTLFEPFVSAYEDRSGLGLALVRRIVDVHRGAVELVEEATGATVFAVTLSVPPHSGA